MDELPEPTEAARFLALVFGLVCVALAGVIYTIAGPGYLIGVGVMAAVGLTYVGLFVFASTRTCQIAVLFLTFGFVPWWD